ncbi:rad52-like recombinase [uncultured Mediterranean phage uvMED]|nr:rad52-like recombinase [uncultured Mediterranean phage uvMED]BAR14833.1 rad52-like recombinase [uncultured Mediterranean phage uvMED]
MTNKRNTQIELSKAWNPSVVKKLNVSYKKDGIAYVEHTQVTQKLIALIDDVQMELMDVFYDTHYNADGDKLTILTGCTYKISGTIDGKFRSVVEAGMCDKPFEVENRRVNNNGERLKECISDAVKRCGMRLGIGIELYDTSAWISSYLDPKPITKSKPKPKAETPKTKAETPKPKIENDKPAEFGKVITADDLAKQIAEKKSIEQNTSK